MTGAFSINIGCGLYYKIFLKLLMQFICKFYLITYIINAIFLKGYCKFKQFSITSLKITKFKNSGAIIKANLQS